MTDTIEIQKNAREVYRVQATEYKGHALVDVRVWYLADDGEYKPSAKGLSIKRDALPEVIKALQSVGGGSS
ncbi:MAG: transcriptional coactivator p15/PC4 family protein [Solimonas sp.]